MILLKGYKPIAFENSTILLVSRNNHIFRYCIPKRQIEYLVSLPSSLWQKFLSLNRLIYRITRGGIRNGVVFDNSLYCTYNSTIWRITLSEPSAKNISEVFQFKNGNSSLSFSTVDEILSRETGFAEGIYFGEYFSNPDKNEVDIYYIDKMGATTKVYTFPGKQINHIHNIVFDKFRACAWVLTGDFDNCAGIWKAVNNFTKVVCVVSGEQKYRSCVAFPVSEGLLYATDSQFELNHISLLTVNEAFPKFFPLFQINGPSIYGTTFCGNYIFTTATEPYATAYPGIKDLLNTNNGPGIVHNRSFVYLVTPFFQVYELFSKAKDIWPYYLAQFGNILVPSGNNLSKYLVTYSVANTYNDQSIEIRDWEEVSRLLKR